MDQGPKSYWAEFLGTFTLCFVGQGAIVMQQYMGHGDLLAVAVAHGLALAIMISALGAVSGGHFNPAVTFGFVVTGRQSWTSAITYWVSQLVGALAASFLLRAVVPGEAGQAVHYGVPAVAASISSTQALLIEFVLTFFLVTSVWGTAVDERAPRIGGFGIGLCVLMDILMGGPLTGAAMNPARAFGAAVASGVWDGQWIWWVGPLLGGAAAARVYKSVVLEH
ncbi:MAG TPA: aquaporin [Candidatus Eisenbacteria bacterium]|nr:aquaporin [Candidatus Eisenbacteria bacterium]